MKHENIANSEKRKSRKQYEINIAEKCKTGHKMFWKYVNTSMKVKNGISKLVLGNGNTAETDEQKSQALNLFFSSFSKNETLDNIPALNCANNSDGVCLPEVVITPAVVLNKFKTLNPTKSEGPDRIPPRVLLELQKFLYIPMTILFNNSIEKGSIPCDRKNAEITAIFFKGIKSNPANDRPISITSAVGKILESIHRDIIVAYINDYNLHSDCQHGFRKHRSCVTQLLHVVEDLSYIFDNGDPFDIIYLDITKAFDQVSHKTLAVKLESYGITSKLPKWISGFLSNRQYVKRAIPICLHR